MLLASTGAYEQCHELVVSCGARGSIRKTTLVDTDLGQFWDRAHTGASTVAAVLRGSFVPASELGAQRIRP